MYWYVVFCLVFVLRKLGLQVVLEEFCQSRYIGKFLESFVNLFENVEIFCLELVSSLPFLSCAQAPWKPGRKGRSSTLLHATHQTSRSQWCEFFDLWHFSCSVWFCAGITLRLNQAAGLRCYLAAQFGGDCRQHVLWAIRSALCCPALAQSTPHSHCSLMCTFVRNDFLSFFLPHHRVLCERCR